MENTDLKAPAEKNGFIYRASSMHVILLEYKVGSLQEQIDSIAFLVQQI